jgi:hypothetical protein
MVSPRRILRKGIPVRAHLAAGELSVLRTCVTKQTGDMVLQRSATATDTRHLGTQDDVYALEGESDYGSTFAVLVELPKGRDVSSGPMSRVWNFAASCLPLNKPLQRDGARGTLWIAAAARIRVRTRRLSRGRMLSSCFVPSTRLGAGESSRRGWKCYSQTWCGLRPVRSATS